MTNDLAMALDLASPLFPKAFLVMACLGSLARAMTSVAGGATRAALTQHFSRCSGKAADVAAKEQSQETAVTILGTLIGIFLSRVCKESQGWVWSSFVLLTWLHIWANLKAVRSLVLTSMNRPRLDAILTKQMKDGGGIVITPDEMKDIEDLTPPPLAALIRYVNPFQLKGARMPDLRMGVSLSHLREVLSERGLSDALQSVEGQKEGRYLVVSEKELVGKGQGVVRYIIFHKAAQPRDVILAYCHAYMAALGLDDGDAKSRSVSLVDNLERAGWDVAGRNSVIVGKCIYHDW